MLLCRHTTFGDLDISDHQDLHLLVPITGRSISTWWGYPRAKTGHRQGFGDGECPVRWLRRVGRLRALDRTWEGPIQAPDRNGRVAPSTQPASPTRHAKLRGDCSNVTAPKQGVADGRMCADRGMKERVHVRQHGSILPVRSGGARTQFVSRGLAPIRSRRRLRQEMSFQSRGAHVYGHRLRAIEYLAA
jgi:hypothetical protein